MRPKLYCPWCGNECVELDGPGDKVCCGLKSGLCIGTTISMSYSKWAVISPEEAPQSPEVAASELPELACFRTFVATGESWTIYGDEKNLSQAEALEIIRLVKVGQEAECQRRGV